MSQDSSDMTEFGKIYDGLRNGALQWARRWFGEVGVTVMGYLWLLPDLVRLLANLLADLRVMLADKIFVASVLIYILSPVDVLPEALLGPFGLVEDLLLAIIVLFRLLGNPHNAQAIQEHWQGDPAVLLKIQRGAQYLRLLLARRR